MEEVDSILIYTLKQIGCEINTRIGELSPAVIIKCVTRCLELIRSDLEIPSYDTGNSMSGRYKVASQIAQAVSEAGYKEDIGCQSFLYPTESETRKILIYLVEKLPRDIDSDVGDRIEVLLSKLAQENEEKAAQETGAGGIVVDGIRLPSAVDVDSLPKETLRFYASHLADISFAKAKEKFGKPADVQPLVMSPVVDEDDDFGDPDEPEPPARNDEPLEKPEIIEKPKVPAKPVVKPPLKEKPKIQVIEEKEEKETEGLKLEKNRKAAEEAASRTKSLQEDTKAKVKRAKLKEKSINEMNQTISSLEEEIKRLRSQIEVREKDLDRQQKTQQLLIDSGDGLDKVKRAVNSQTEKILNLANQWETHRKPLIEEIRKKRAENASKISETTKQREEVRRLKLTLKEMGAEAKEKEELYAQLLAEYDKMPKDLNRSAYTKRICEIIGNIKKQKREITKVITDTKEIQKDINSLSGRLDRTFAVADELIFKDAEKDKNVAQSYKLLVSIHSDFSRIIKTLEEMGNLKRMSRDLEDKVELEKAKNFESKLERLRADLAQMQKENQILQATLRDPTAVRRSSADPVSTE